MAGPRSANPALLPQNIGQDLGLGQVLSSLLCGPTSNLVSAPLSGNCQRAPPPHVPVFWPWGSCQTSQTSLDPRTPGLLLRLKPSHLPFGTTNHSSWNPAPVSALGLIQFSSPVLLDLPEVTSLCHDLPNACSRRTHGKSGDVCEADSKF